MDRVIEAGADQSGLEIPIDEDQVHFPYYGDTLDQMTSGMSAEEAANPPNVSRWFNAMDERDVVALYPLTSENFNVDPPIENKTDVDNPTPNRHGISGYLGDPVGPPHL
jgi:hypothetical protein